MPSHQHNAPTLEQLASLRSSDGDAAPSFVSLMLEGISRAYLLCTDVSGRQFMPTIASIWTGKLLTNQRSINSAFISRYDDILSRDHLGIRPNEICFSGPDMMDDRPLWSVGIGFVSPAPLQHVLGSLEFRNIERRNPAAGVTGTPKIYLGEWFIAAGKPTLKEWVRAETLSAAELAHKRFAIGAAG